MITIIIGTNRTKSEAAKFGKQYYQTLLKLGETVNFIHLKDIPPTLYHAEMYDMDLQPELLAIQQNILLPSDKFLFVIPEYNGGMPGALKLFIDALSIHERDKTFSNKKAAIVGVSTGRAGNLRGMEHLTGILNYLGIIVMPNKQPFSSIHMLINNNGTITDKETINVIQNHVKQLIAF